MQIFVKGTKPFDTLILIYKKEFMCELYGAQFSLGDICIVAGLYHIDIDDLKYKIDTFQEGDSRRIKFIADGKFQTYFIRDIKMAQSVISFDQKSEPFSIKNMSLNFGRIFEKTGKI